MRAVEPGGGGLLRPSASYGEVKKGYTAIISGDVIMAKITPCMENGKTTLCRNCRVRSASVGTSSMSSAVRRCGSEVDYQLPTSTRCARSANVQWGAGIGGAGEARAIPGGVAQGRGGRRVDRRLAEEASQGRASLGLAHPHPRRTPPPLGRRSAPQVQGSRQGTTQELEGEIQEPVRRTRPVSGPQRGGVGRPPTNLLGRQATERRRSVVQLGVHNCSAYSQHHRREARH